jgi:hypothetical protein
MNKACNTLASNVRAAKQIWGEMAPTCVDTLKTLTANYCLSVAAGELLLIDGRWYITHAGLLRISNQSGCFGIKTESAPEFCDPTAFRYCFKATVYKSHSCKGFVGYGDADPSNVSPLVRGAEMRVAETRAVNRALRKAYGIGLCSVEELGARSDNAEPPIEARKRPSQSAGKNGSHNGSGNGNGGPRVRDRLCQIIRRHSLDPELVKAYAVDYCGTSSLKEAQRDQVEKFVRHLAEWAERDRDALLCQLNSYPKVEQQAQANEGAA